MSSKPAATLLFCHGGGFCKEVWTPVISRLAQKPLLGRVAANMATFDFPYHGSNRNVSEPSTLLLENPESPRVSHPAMHWAKWSPKEVQRQVALLRAQDVEGTRKPLIGIGHSMGAAALWATEVANPGTFDGLVLFEPMINVDADMVAARAVDFLVSITLKRRHNWESKEEATADILSMRNFARWHRESLKGYATGAVVQVTSKDNVLDPTSKFALSCHPHIEASLYCGDTMRLSEQQMASVKCPITFQYGSLTQLFSPESRQPLVDKYPHLYQLAAPIPNTTHTLVMEDPDTCVDRIVDALAKLPLFAEPTTTSRL